VGAGASLPLVAGDFGRPPLAPAGVRNGDAVRLEGVPVRDGGLLGLLIVGLSQEEKKSSAGSPAGVLLLDDSSASSPIRTSLGYLLR
jgi:hypothetical protein